MGEELLVIREFTGAGYQPLVDFDTWRVALLRWEQASLPENITSMERHTQTDEVFVLLQGRATLILGGNSFTVERIQSQVIEPRKLYNVRQEVWHTVLLSRDASILIVENRNTGIENTEYCPLTNEIKQKIISMRLVGE